MSNANDDTEFRREGLRANRLNGHLNDLLKEEFPDEAQRYEIVTRRVSEYMNETAGPGPFPVRPNDEPTYEYYLKPKDKERPQARVMITDGGLLRTRVKGGIPKEKAYFQIPHFKGHLGRKLRGLESETGV